MNKILNQFRRIYSDDGRHDVNFSEREEALQRARRKVVIATTHLVKASERLNAAALKAFPAKGQEN